MLRSPRPFLSLVAVAISGLLSGCDDLLGVECTSILLHSLAIEVRDSGTGAPSARGVTGFSDHESGVRTEFSAADDLLLRGDWRRELPGTHLIHLWKPGFGTVAFSVTVGENRCHVEPEVVQAQMAPSPQAVFQAPLSFVEGPEVGGWPASAGIRMFGDTLEISGFAPTECERLRATAFRTGIELHVQIEPSDTPLDRCVSPRQFEVRYLMPPGTTSLLVTNGYSFPAILFDGQVNPPAGPPRPAGG